MTMSQPGEELLVRMPGDGGTMSDELIDGRYVDAEGRSKIFVRRREDESEEQFAQRAMALLIQSGQIVDLEDRRCPAQFGYFRVLTGPVRPTAFPYFSTARSAACWVARCSFGGSGYLILA